MIEVDGRTLYLFGRLASTMDEARARVAEGCPGGSIVMAEEQTSGRGRVPGRTWWSLPGQSLLMTIVMPDGSAGIPALPLRVGLGVCSFLESRLPGLDFAIKWPNDILVEAGGWRKVCGILVESARGRALAGMGLNLSQRDFPEIGVRPGAEHGIGPGSLLLALERSGSGSPIPAADAATACALALAVESACARDDWRDAVESRLWAKGSPVRFAEGHPDLPVPHEGLLAGIDAGGRILIDGGSGEMSAYASGEIHSLRAAP